MREALARTFAAVAIGVLSAVIGISGGGFLAAALYLALLALLPPAGAAAVTGLALLLATGVLLLTGRAFLRRGRREPPPADGARGEAQLVTDLLAGLLPHARRHLPLVTGLSFAAGLVLGLKPSARRALWRSLTR